MNKREKFVPEIKGTLRKHVVEVPSIIRDFWEKNKIPTIHNGRCNNKKY